MKQQKMETPVLYHPKWALQYLTPHFTSHSLMERRGIFFHDKS